MKKFLFFILLFAALSGIGYWFWNLGSVKAPARETIELIVQQPGVQARSSDKEEWKAVTSNMRIEKGWSIKTDASGLATVRFYGLGESRLDHDSELLISESSFDQASQTKMKVGVLLQAGRIWTRVLRLFDIESSYSVRTSDVVATVRGTAFDVAKTGSGTVAVTVGESAVTVASVSEPNKIIKAVAEGSIASFSAGGSNASVRGITAEDQSSGWFVSNDMADQAFIKQAMEKRADELSALGGMMPDSALANVATLSERVHLALAKDEEKNQLLEDYLSRRVYHLIQLVKNGKTGLASQEFTRLENDLQAQMDAKPADAQTDYIRAAVFRIALLTDDSNPGDAMYPFKQRIERLFESVSSSSELGKMYARLVAFDARMNEAVRLISNKSFDAARTSLDGVKSGLENVRRDAAPMLSSLSDEYRAALDGKLQAQEMRERAIRTSLESALHPMIQLTTSTDMLSGSATGTEAVRAEDIESISFSASPNPLNIGQRTKFTVLANMKDGTKKNVTAFSVFESVQAYGKLNGPSYVGTSIGSDEIIAKYASFQAATKIQTKGEIKLVDLVISSSAGSRLSVGQKTTLYATARYNNGVTKNVTDQAVFVVVSGGGDVNGTVFVNNGAMLGDTVIAGTYKDQAITSIGSIKITVGN